MDNKSKKSKAFIITFIAVLALLLILFFLFMNKDKILGTKSSNNTGNIFTPLISYLKPKSLSTINNGTNTNNNTNSNTNTNTSTNTNNNTNTNPDNGNNTNTNTNNNTNTNTNTNNNTNSKCTDQTASNFGGSLPCQYNVVIPTNLQCADKNASNYGGSLPCSYPIVIPDPTLCQDNSALNYQGSLPCQYKNNGNDIHECSDKIDNDGDGLTDANDPGCHSDYDETNAKSYDPKINDESRKKTIITPDSNICLDDPLDKYFTVKEKAKLAVLLRKFYLVAPTLKTQDDIDLVKNDTNQDNALIAQSKDLIKQCESQLLDPAYTGVKTAYGNPYYKPSPVGHYVPTYETFENMFYIW